MTESPARRSAVIAVRQNAAELEPIAAHLRRRGYEVRVAQTANEALHICRTEAVDLVISNVLFMQGMNGLELAQRVGSGTKVVLVSPFPDEILSRLPGFPPKDVPILKIPLDLEKLDQHIPDEP